MSNQDDGVVVKKVKAFPIAAGIKTAEGQFIPVQIVKLTKQGFLAELAPTPIQPGEKFEVHFEIPVYHTKISEPVVMVKLYQHWGQNSAPVSADKSASAAEPTLQPQQGAGIMHLVEMHFQNLSITSRNHIDTFLSQVQKRTP